MSLSDICISSVYDCIGKDDFLRRSKSLFVLFSSSKEEKIFLSVFIGDLWFIFIIFIGPFS
jgi:hypothetical protein